MFFQIIWMLKRNRLAKKWSTIPCLSIIILRMRFQKPFFLFIYQWVVRTLGVPDEGSGIPQKQE